MQLRDLLAGFEPGKPQIVGNMAVIPLVASRDEFQGIAGAENVMLAQDDSYSKLTLAPVEERLTIVPAGFTYLTKEHAQDRAVPVVSVMEGDTKTVQAFCVQSSQAGHMSSERVSEREVRLLPHAIRHYAFSVAPSCVGKYDSLWDKLTKYNSSLNVRGNYLCSLMEHYKEQLSLFVAQFEPIHGQRGAIVIINGRVVGIDIMPSFHSFLQIWQQLIRDCYGMEAIAKQNETRSLKPIAPLKQVTALSDLMSAVMTQIDEEKEWAYGITKTCMGSEIDTLDSQAFNSSQVGTVDVMRVKGEELEGNIVSTQQGKAIYLSLFRHAFSPAKVKAFSL